MISQNNEDIWYEIVVMIEQNDIEEVKKLLSENSEFINECDETTGNLLHAAAEENASYEMIKMLSEIGCDINMYNESSEQNVLSYLMLNNPDDVYEKVKLLIELGAKMDTRSNIINPLFKAIDIKSFDIAKLLIENGIDLSVQYEEMDGMMHYHMQST